MQVSHKCYAASQLDLTSSTASYRWIDNYGYVDEEIHGNKLLFQEFKRQVGEFPLWLPLATQVLNLFKSIPSTNWKRWDDWIDNQGYTHPSTSYETKYGNFHLSTHTNWEKMLTKTELFGEWSYGKISYGILITDTEIMVGVSSVNVGSCTITGPKAEIIALLFS